jgi:hypothetical protein
LPFFLGCAISSFARALVGGANALMDGPLFGVCRWICWAGNGLRWAVLEPFFSFTGGGPPEQVGVVCEARILLFD